MTSYEMESADLEDLQGYLFTEIFDENILEMLEGDPFDTSKCNCTLRHTRGWAKRNGLSPELVEQFLRHHRAKCDCEAVLNPDPDECCLDASSTCRHREVPAPSPSTRGALGGPIAV